MRLPVLALAAAVLGAALLTRLVPDGSGLGWSPPPVMTPAGGRDSVAVADVAVRAVAPLGRPLPAVRAIPKRATPRKVAPAAVGLNQHRAPALPLQVGGPHCDETQAAGDQARYEGDSVSGLYDILSVVEGPWVVPTRLQGLVVTAEDFVFASDEGRGPGELTVFRRAAPPDLDDDPVACLRVPSMPENMTGHEGRVFASDEGGAAQYAGQAR
jgi:hypothetical protein